MAREKRLVVGHVLDADDVLRIHLHDAVDEEKGEAVGQNGPNFVDIQNGHGSSYYNAESVPFLRREPPSYKPTKAEIGRGPQCRSLKPAPQER
jgi:hypothetical protein